MLARSPADLPPCVPGILPRDAVVAIDGPAGSGKSTTARALAERFGLLYIDTGAMYRALTLAAFTGGVDTADGEGLARLLVDADLELRPGRGEVVVSWNGRDVSDAIRTPEVDAAVSAVSAHAAVRRDMVRRQQAFGRRGGVVMEGRDIGSVVFPLATAKIFLRASLEARVARRVRQFRLRGREIDPGAVHRDLVARDRLDSERDASPLVISPDAIIVDSSDLGLESQNEACARACGLNPALDHELDDDLDRARADLPWQYRLAYATFGALARFYGLRQVGNLGRALPRGTIVAANHTSYWDPPLLGSTFHRHPVHTLAKEELFRPSWLMGRFFNFLDAIPIRRKGYDEAAFTTAKAALAGGANLLIFPEGTRRPVGEPGPVKNGLGIVVQATRAPIIPVFIRGSHGRSPGGSTRSPLEIRWGPVVRFHALEELLTTLDGKEVNRRIARVCEAAWRELQERSYADHPPTPYEQELGSRQHIRFARRHERLFGPPA